MNPEYQFSTIESAVQSAWQTADSFSVDEKSDKPKFYCLSMFPYPSGKLHMGHVRNYTIGDVISRFQRMQGKNVLQPMGWDAFGLPAENAAIKNQSAPASWTHDNINYMRKQLKSLGFAYDWKRELATCEPDYYRWEQWLFTRLFEKGLVYKKKATVNWDPVDNCVLANEQVIDGRGWRSGALVEQRDINQWFMKITDYADELLADVQELDGWPQMVRTMQSNWIGKSKGLNITFDVAGHDNMTVFTTRPDTLMGVTYVAIAPGHPIALAAAENNSNIAEFVEQSKQQKVAEAELATMEKLGIDTGLTATHPLTGDAVPIWVANFVLMSYGTGAVMSVPAHDERDHAFALKYGLPIKQVIAAPDEIDIQRQAYTEKATCVNSGDFDGLNFEQSFEAIQAQLESLTKGELVYNYRLRDWGISRQRYWGCPIPIIYCDDCGVLPVPEKDLPVVLPTDVAFDSTGKSPLPTRDDFVNAPCPSCGKAATRETDTFDTFYESSWYYARYTSYDNNEAMLDERANYWLPVDQYVGGVEHAVMHLLYARFFHKLMRDEGLVSSDEPFTRLLTQGMVLADTYCREDETGKQTWYAPADIKNETDAKGKVLSSSLKDDGQPVMHAGMSKMSKSKNNGVDPQYLIDQYGADTIRLFSMFASPPDQSMEWADAGVEGAQRFLKRLWRISYDFIEQNGTDVPEVGEYNDAQNDLRRKLHQTLSKVTDDMGRRLTYNTAIAANMELVNELSKFSDNSPAGVALKHDVISHVVLMLAPITPHICQALWEQLGYSGLLVDAAWPIVDEEALAQDSIELVVQVNGKVRGKVKVAAEADNATVEAAALADPNVQNFTQQGEVKKVIVVPGRLVNIVVV